LLHTALSPLPYPRSPPLLLLLLFLLLSLFLLVFLFLLVLLLLLLSFLVFLFLLLVLLLFLPSSFSPPLSPPPPSSLPLPPFPPPPSPFPLPPPPPPITTTTTYNNNNITPRTYYLSTGFPVLNLPDIISRFSHSMYLQLYFYNNLLMKFHISSSYCTAGSYVLHPATIFIPCILQNTGPQKERCIFIYQIRVRV
jgi:ABC-type transport system involved in multi-copper enzyme maturation permease subunit